MAALQSDDPLVRTGGLVGADGLDPTLKHQLVIPLLDDDVRGVRIDAARVLSSVPAERFTPDQRSLFMGVLEEYRDVQKLNADWPEAHMNLGVVDAQLGELERAEQGLPCGARTRSRVCARVREPGGPVPGHGPKRSQ